MNENKKVNKHDWVERGAEAKRQEELFKKMSLADSEKNVENFEALICRTVKSFALESDIYRKNVLGHNLGREKCAYREKIETELPIEVDMKEVTMSSKNMNKYIAAIVRKMSSFIDDKSGEYIYVVQRNDGMVTVVGCSSFEFEEGKNDGGESGDLFKQLNLSGLAGTENIILRNHYGNAIDDLLLNYYKKAWIIPIPKTTNKELYDSKSKQLEKELGEYIIKKKFPILNYFSHTS